MSKKQKPVKRPNLSPATLLRPRLDGLIQNEDWLNRGQAEIFADLDAVCKSIVAKEFLPVVASAVEAAPGGRQSQISAVVGVWLAERDYLATLAELAKQAGLPPAAQHQAATWLRSAGYGDITLAPSAPHEFAAAWYGKDEFDSQGLLTILWYAHRGNNDATGLQFLLDYNPPWYGSIKDVMKLPRRSFAGLIDDVQSLWESKVDLERIDAVQAKRQAILHLENNRTQGIRLHRDVIALRDVFIQRVLGLPDGPETPHFGVADFDELCTLTGQTAESIMHFEQTVARQVIMPDGKILYVGADIANEPD